MPAPKPFRPTIYFRAGYWRIREPMPHPFYPAMRQRWGRAHDFVAWLNRQPFALQLRDACFERVWANLPKPCISSRIQGE